MPCTEQVSVQGIFWKKGAVVKQKRYRSGSGIFGLSPRAIPADHAEPRQENRLRLLFVSECDWTLDLDFRLGQRIIFPGIAEVPAMQQTLIEIYDVNTAQIASIIII